MLQYIDNQFVAMRTSYIYFRTFTYLFTNNQMLRRL
jgi:hypothetical protein